MQAQKRERRQQIVEAARRVFAREGFRGATIEKIAVEAGLKSPSLVYWYFKDKKGLFQAVAEDVSPMLGQLPALWKRIDEPPEVILPYIAKTFLSSFDNPQSRQLFRIFLSEAPRQHHRDTIPSRPYWGQTSVLQESGSATHRAALF